MIDSIQETFNDDINSARIVIVDFYASWCSPCKLMKKVLESAESKLKTYNYIKFYMVNTDNEPEIATQFSIVSIPHIIFFKNGFPVRRTTGLLNEQQLLDVLNEIKVEVKNED